MPRIGTVRAGNPEWWIVNGSNMFVDAVAGNDANDGFSPPRAKKTNAGVRAASPSSGIKVYLKRGQKHDAIATWATNCEIRDYGSLADKPPIIFHMEEILGVAADWVEINDAGIATPGTFKWQTDLSARGIDVHSTASNRSRVVVNDGGWLPTDYQLQLIMSGSVAFITAEKQWRASIPTTTANQKVTIYSDNPTVPGLDNPADRWTSIGVGKPGTAVTISPGHTGTILRNLRCMGGSSCVAISETCTTYDCQFDNGGTVNVSIIAPKDQTHYRLKAYRSGTSSNGTHGVKINYAAADHTACNIRFWDADVAWGAEDCVQMQTAGTGTNLELLSTYPGATMVGSCADTENPLDMKSGNFKAHGVIAQTTGAEYQCLTVQGSVQKVTVDQCFFNALQSGKGAINGQERENYWRVTRSLFYAASNTSVVAMWQSGGGAAQNQSIFEGNIFYTRGSGNGVGIFAEGHHFKFRHNMFITRTVQGAAAIGLSRRTAAATLGIALLKHDGVDHGGYYNATIYTTNLTLGAAWLDTHSVTIASMTTGSTGWNGTWALDTVGLDPTGKYYFATFQLTIISAGVAQPTVPAFNNVSLVPTFSINSVSQPMSIGSATTWLTAVECLATTGGFQTIRFHNCVNDYVPALGGNAFIAGAPAGYEAINGTHVVTSIYMVSGGENEYFDILLPAASQVNGGAAGMIDPSGFSTCFPPSLLAMDGNMFISDCNIGNSRPSLQFDLKSVFGQAFGANYYHMRTADFPLRILDGGTGAINYTTANMTGTGAGTVHAATGGMVGNNASDVFETAAFDSSPPHNITSITVNALARLATIEFAGHGLSAGQPVLLESQGTQFLRGGKPVHSVIDANHFTVRIPYELAESGDFTEATPGNFQTFKVPVGSKALNAAPVVAFDLITTDIGGNVFDATPHFGPMQLAA